MIGTLAPDRTDQAFNMTVLPFRHLELNLSL
jgi:hypothetical protein